MSNPRERGHPLLGDVLSPEFAIAVQYNPVVINNNKQLFFEAIRRVPAVVHLGLEIGMMSEDRYLYYLHLQTNNPGIPVPSCSSSGGSPSAWSTIVELLSFLLVGGASLSLELLLQSSTVYTYTSALWWMLGFDRYRYNRYNQ